MVRQPPASSISIIMSIVLGTIDIIRQVCTCNMFATVCFLRLSFKQYWQLLLMGQWSSILDYQSIFTLNQALSNKNMKSIIIGINRNMKYNLLNLFRFILTEYEGNYIISNNSSTYKEAAIFLPFHGCYREWNAFKIFRYFIV